VINYLLFKQNLELTMKKICSLLAAVLVTGLSASPVSASGSYVSGNGGISWFNNIRDGGVTYRLNSNFNANGAIGLRQNCYRLEGELGYQINNVNKVVSVFGTSGYEGHVAVWSLLANGYWDIPTGSDIKPYLTAGLGGARVRFENLGFPGAGAWNERHSLFAYQLGAGLAIPVSPGVMLDARYRYFSTANFTLADGFQSRVSSNNASLGLRFKL
jgi:opacity protein-like surface antigen